MTDRHMPDRKQVRDRIAAIGQPILYGVLFVAMIAIAFLAWKNYQQGQLSVTTNNNHHAQTIAQNKTIIAQNKEIKKLLKEHSGLLNTVAAEQKQLAAAEQAITADGNYIVAWQQWAASEILGICASAGVTCSAPPAPPGG